MAAFTHGQVNLLKLNFERAIVVTVTDDLLGFTHITIYRVCSEYSERQNIQ